MKRRQQCGPFDWHASHVRYVLITQAWALAIDQRTEMMAEGGLSFQV